jgi:phosphatidylinositol glycan class M
MIPNVLIHTLWGKILFVAADMLVANQLVKFLESFPSKITKQFLLTLWILNPLVINVSTRGSADSIVCFLVLLSLWMIEHDQIILGSIVYALAVHFKIYPIIFSLAIFCFLGKTKQKITLQQLKFVFTFGMVFLGLTLGFYRLYGHEFLVETYLYHLVRIDPKHNFSVHFLSLYLGAPMFLQRIWPIVTFAPQALIIWKTSFRIGPRDLVLCATIHTLCFVSFNKVVTAQYFVWYMSLFPIAFARARLSIKKIVILLSLWYVAELHWLAWAGALELQGKNVFVGLWAAAVIFFAVNIYILKTLCSAAMNVESKHLKND